MGEIVWHHAGCALCFGQLIRVAPDPILCPDGHTRWCQHLLEGCERDLTRGEGMTSDHRRHVREHDFDLRLG